MPLATFSIGGESFSEQRCQRKNKTCYASKTGIFEELFKRDVSEMPHIARPRRFAPFPRPQKQTGWPPLREALGQIEAVRCTAGLPSGIAMVPACGIAFCKKACLARRVEA